MDVGDSARNTIGATGVQFRYHTPEEFGKLTQVQKGQGSSRRKSSVGLTVVVVMIVNDTLAAGVKHFIISLFRDEVSTVAGTHGQMASIYVVAAMHVEESAGQER